MKRLLAFVAAFAAILTVGNLCAQTQPRSRRGTPTRVPQSQKTPAAPMGNFDREELAPEADDPIGAPADWQDAKGERSIKGELQSATADAIKLKKSDSSIVTIPLKLLHKSDRERVVDFRYLASKRKIAAAVEDFFDTDFGDTDARVLETEKTALGKLQKRVNGRDLRLCFPITNVEEARHEKGIYGLTLGQPDFPGSSWKFTNSLDQKLTKDQALAIGTETVLVVDGKASMRFERKYPPQNGYFLLWDKAAEMPGGGTVIRQIELNVEHPHFTVRNPPGTKPAN